MRDVEEKKVRVLIVDDADSVRKGLGIALETFDDVEIVGEAANGQEAVDLCAKVHPDVVLMDVALPRTDVAHIIRRIHEMRPEIQVIATISFEEQATIDAVMQAGAALCLSKYTPVLRIAELVRQVGQSARKVKIS